MWLEETFNIYVDCSVQFSPGVVVCPAVAAAELWDGLSVDNEDDIVVLVVAAVAAAVVSVSVTTVTAMVGLVPGVVFP